MDHTIRYSRQTMLAELGPEGQKRLAEASVLLVGIGGLGSPVAIYLAGAGVGRIGLADSDIVGLSNLQRQILYCEDELGLPKTECARKRLKKLNSDVVVQLYPEGINPANAMEIISGYDLVVDCCDNFATRFLLDDVCHKLGKAWVHGSISEFYGQVALFGGESGKRYSNLYADRELLCARPKASAGVLGPVPGIIGTIQAAQALQVLAGFGKPLWGKLFTIDVLTMNTSIIEI